MSRGAGALECRGLLQAVNERMAEHAGRGPRGRLGGGPEPDLDRRPVQGADHVARPQHRELILKSCLEPGRDRIVVTHGTDTMPETARYLGERVAVLSVDPSSPISGGRPRRTASANF